MESHDLRRAGLKVTHPRMRILEILDQAGARHLTAEDIYRQLLDGSEDIGLATVYRVLTQFEAAGLVLKHNFEGGHAVFELDRGEHHDHMVDLDTGKVIEFSSPEIEQLQQQIADRHGYVIQAHSLVLYVRGKGGRS
ncbi:MAG: ferric iron uptake transcriptional regulator [Proteobacteria bacterium]|nr:ferric iron uptake transcriptional regulator [Pseudomonadota bacterium]